MKKELSTCPKGLKEEYGFSWMEHVLAIPSPLVTVTTYKNNGAPNATMQSWCTFVGEENSYHVIFGSVNKCGHMYKSCKETNCCVVNLPSKEVFHKCMETINNNEFDTDEITASRLTSVKAHKVNAPMIDECMVSLECEFEWEHDLVENGSHAVMCFKVINIWMEENLWDENIQGRYGNSGYLYNIHSPQNPNTGEEYETFVGTITKNATYDYLN